MKPLDLHAPALLARCDEVLRGVRRLRALPEEGGSRGRGSSIAGGPFRAHRRYVPGDDPRRVDWYAYARTGELNIKLFEADRTRTLPLLVDMSSSLEFGTPPRWHTVLETCAILLYVGLALADRVDIHLAGGRAPASRLSLRGAAELHEGLTFLEQVRPGGRDGQERAMANLLKGRRGGDLWWLSDFFPLDLGALEVARERRFRVRGLLPLVPQDTRPRPAPIASVRDLEGSGQALLRVTPKLLERVEALWEEEIALVGTRLGATGGGLHLLDPTRQGPALVAALA